MIEVLSLDLESRRSKFQGRNLGSVMAPISGAGGSFEAVSCGIDA